MSETAIQTLNLVAWIIDLSSQYHARYFFLAQAVHQIGLI